MGTHISLRTLHRMSSSILLGMIFVKKKRMSSKSRSHSLTSQYNMQRSKAFKKPFKRYDLQSLVRRSRPRKLAIFKTPMTEEMSTFNYPV